MTANQTQSSMYVIMNASVMYAEMQLHNKKDIEIRPQDLNFRPLNSIRCSYQLSHWSSGIEAEDYIDKYMQ